ncbi:MAG: FlgD immunoglobulin-like domain containing protein [Elusimicrobiota bacterium]|jgi:Zn-dependent metalloprotease
MKRAGLLGILLLVCSVRAPFSHAVRPEPFHRSDAQRFHLDKPEESSAADRIQESRTRLARERFNARSAGRYSRSMRAAAASGAQNAAPAAQRVAEDFLSRSKDLLGIDASELRLERMNSDGGLHHLLFQQVYAGIPVEFSRIKVHIDNDGRVLSAQNGARELKSPNTVPVLSEAAAAAAAAADLGLTAPAAPSGSLVFFPRRTDSVIVLAWKIRINGAGGRWYYYVDAADGTLLLRYNELSFQACTTSGTVTGEVYDYDPDTYPSPTLAVKAIPDQRVYVADAVASALTNNNGVFCSGSTGKIHTSLQGPYVNVSNHTAPNAHYDNGTGVWSTASTPRSSPHPYPNDSLLYSTFTVSAGVCAGGRDPVKVLPVFSAFDVGAVSLEGDILDDDQVEVLDSAGVPAAAYAGAKGSFRGTSVAGRTGMLRLRSDAGGSHYGYDVSLSSYLCLTNAPTVSNNPTATFQWNTSKTFDGTRDEINIFYHLNKAHDYFMGGPNASTSTYIPSVAAVAHMGPNLANAYYDPLQKALYFGDVANGFAVDGSVIQHEYAHFVTDQVFPMLNFGQNGAISEALADYFAGSSLNKSAIAKYTSSVFGEGVEREMDATKSSSRIFPEHWTGELHADSLIVSQALWEMRQSFIDSSLGAVNGKKCADRLVFRSLFFYPDNFRDFAAALLETNSTGLVSVCGVTPAEISANSALITAAFATHNIAANPPRDGSDVYEPNDGISSATDISTAPAVSARIYPAADQDYYSVAAAAGPLKLTLSLPDLDGLPGIYYAYGMILLDGNYNVLAESWPPIDVNPSMSGSCPNDPLSPCQTTAGQVVLEYSAPSAGPYYVAVSAAPADDGSNDVTNSSRFYTLRADYTQTGAVAASVVTASYDRDVISFQANVSIYISSQSYSFDHAQLRDHSLSPLPQTNVGRLRSSPYLSVVYSTASAGVISGRLRLTQGFAARFPAVGSIHLEVFGVTGLGHEQSLGLSQEVLLTAQENSLSAWNNVFNPLRGEKAVFKYETTGAGRVRLRLFTMSGQLVRTFIDEDRPAGKGSADWNGTNPAGNRVASGIYLLHLSAPGFEKVQKVIVVK